MGGGVSLLNQMHNFKRIYLYIDMDSSNLHRHTDVMLNHGQLNMHVCGEIDVLGEAGDSVIGSKSLFCANFVWWLVIVRGCCNFLVLDAILSWINGIK